jgi:hypothetical protein
VPSSSPSKRVRTSSAGPTVLSISSTERSAPPPAARVEDRSPASTPLPPPSATVLPASSSEEPLRVPYDPALESIFARRPPVPFGGPFEHAPPGYLAGRWEVASAAHDLVGALERLDEARVRYLLERDRVDMAWVRFNESVAELEPALRVAYPNFNLSDFRPEDISRCSRLVREGEQIFRRPGPSSVIPPAAGTSLSARALGKRRTSPTSDEYTPPALDGRSGRARASAKGKARALPSYDDFKDDIEDAESPESGPDSGEEPS